MEKKSVVVKPTNNCNLQCKYCYNSGSNIIMSHKTLENTLSKTITHHRKYPIHFLWHGGEPLLAGLDFYKEAIKIQNKTKKKSQHIFNSIQTNLTLMDEAYLEFFSRTNFSISFSLDGNKELNDSQRVYRNGKGSYEDVIKKVEMFKERDIPLRAIIVINRQNVNRLEDIYSFFRDYGINFKIHPLVKAGRALENSSLEISPQEYGKFMIKLFDIWFNDVNNTNRIKIEPFFQYVGNLMFQEPGDCATSKNCQSFLISVAPNGDVYPCWRFDGDTELKYGNINEDSMESILKSDIRKKILTRSPNAIKDCVECEFKGICNAGCMNHAYNEGNLMDKDPHCTSMKMIYSHIKKTLEKI